MRGWTRTYNCKSDEQCSLCNSHAWLDWNDLWTSCIIARELHNTPNRLYRSSLCKVVRWLELIRYLYISGMEVAPLDHNAVWMCILCIAKSWLWQACNSWCVQSPFLMLHTQGLGWFSMFVKPTTAAIAHTYVTNLKHSRNAKYEVWVGGVVCKGEGVNGGQYTMMSHEYVL